MRLFFITIFLACFFSRATAQNNKHVSVSELVAISDNSDFTGLVKLAHKLSHTMFDSSRSKDGSLFYYAKEFKIGGNILSCNIKADSIMNLLGFYTIDSNLNIELRKQIIDLGYTTKGKTKFKVSGYEETQEFNKDKKIIAWSVTKRDGGQLEYGFEFIRF